jgi:hypothetical protein
MSVIDKVVNEWAFRCKKGYPDMNNPDDMKILKEIYSEYGVVLEEEKPKEEVDNQALLSQIATLLQAEKGNSKLLTRIYRTLTSNPSIDALKQKLEDAGIGKNTFDNRNLFNEIITILQKGEKSDIGSLVKYLEQSKIPKEGNIYTQVPELPTQKLQAIGNLTGAKGTTAMGKGEILFPLIFSDIKLRISDAGDFTRNGKTVELKAIGVGKEGKQSGGGRFGVARAFENYEPLNTNVAKGFSQAMKNDYLSFSEEEKDKPLSNINKYIQKIYPGSSQVVDKSNIQSLNILLQKAAIESYVSIKKIDEFLLFNPITGDFKLITPAKALVDLAGTPEVGLTTATVPQLIYFN